LEAFGAVKLHSVSGGGGGFHRFALDVKGECLLIVGPHLHRCLDVELDEMNVQAGLVEEEVLAAVFNSFLKMMSMQSSPALADGQGFPLLPERLPISKTKS
jgi:hypothetical protein